MNTSDNRILQRGDVIQLLPGVRLCSGWRGRGYVVDVAGNLVDFLKADNPDSGRCTVLVEEVLKDRRKKGEARRIADAIAEHIKRRGY